jgi:hypothetical protein
MSDTPETDAAVETSGGDWSPVLRAVAQSLERDEAIQQNAKLRDIAEKDDEKLDNEYNKTLDTELSIYCRAKWNAAIDDRDTAILEAEKLREQNAKLREIAERAIDAVSNQPTESFLRAELDQLKEGAK